MWNSVHYKLGFVRLGQDGGASRLIFANMVFKLIIRHCARQDRLVCGRVDDYNIWNFHLTEVAVARAAISSVLAATRM